MKGLILRELYVLKKIAKPYIAMLILFPVLTVITNGKVYFSVFSALFAGLIPYIVLYYDERGKWDIYSQILPITRAKSVAANYIVGILIVFCVTVLTSIGLLFAKDTLTYTIGLILTFIVGLLMPSVTLPIYYRLGTIKGKYVGMIIAGALGGFSAMLFNSFTLEDSYMNDVLKSIRINPFIASAIIIVSVGIYVLSCLLSIRLYKNREL